MQELTLHLLEFLFQLDQMISVPISLFQHLMFLLNILNLLIIIQKFAKIPIIIIDNFNLKSSFVHRVNISSQFHLKSLGASRLVKETLNSHGISDWIDN